MKGVLASQVPDLQAKRVAADTRLDPPVDADLAPRPTDKRLPRLPLLEHFQRVHRSPNPYAARVPSTEAIAGGQLVQGPVQAGLVVDLVGRQMGDDIHDAPAATVAVRRPTPLVEAAKVGPEPRNLPVVDGEGISASWVEGSCAWRWPASPSTLASARQGLRWRPARPARYSSRLTSSPSPFPLLRRIEPRLVRRSARWHFLYAAALPGWRYSSSLGSVCSR